MSIRLLVLKSGEDLISVVNNMIVNDKVVGYYLKRPCVIDIKDAKKYNENTGKTAIDISLIPWVPLSKSDMIPIPTDWVVTIVEPVDKLLEMYQTEVWKDDQITSIEQPSTDSED